MNLKKIQDADLKNKRVLVRVDFNVGIEDGHTQEEFKISVAKETINYICSQDKAKLAIITHLGRPDGKKDPTFSLNSIKKDLERILDRKVKFVDDCVGQKVKDGFYDLPAGDILLLENVRFYEGEEKNSEEFAKQLSENFDVFVNDAFSVCHRDQASVTGVAKILPSYAGFRLQKELENLSKVMVAPEKPSVAIIGGAKIETKLPLIEKFQKTYDIILIGGMIANEAIDKNIQFPDNVFLPVDFAKDRLDIGPKTIEDYKKIISTAKTIVWNGPMGKFEEAPYDTGTKEILSAVVGSGAFSVMGGGESVQLLEETKSMEKISFISTGGGAMLEFHSGDKLPGIEALLKAG
jgi:phosphoglycerate kinase